MSAAIRIQQVSKAFGNVQALDRVDLEISPASSSACSAPTAPARRR
jgi:ABC-type sugar transport system ATPase subunit